jgi:uncharacterized protein YceK
MKLTFLLTLAVVLSGCGSIGQNGMPARDDGVDRDKMAQVERAAERSGARVHWVNPPLKQPK